MRWIPAGQAPVVPPNPPPPPPPPRYTYLPPAYAYTAQVAPAPSPGLRTFLLVMLGIDVAATGFMSLFGLLGVSGSGVEASGVVLWLVFVVLLALAIVALVGVIIRAVWARWVALAAGIAVCLTCLGAVIGIPIIVAAARAPLGKSS